MCSGCRDGSDGWKERDPRAWKERSTTAEDRWKEREAAIVQARSFRGWSGCHGSYPGRVADPSLAAAVAECTTTLCSFHLVVVYQTSPPSSSSSSSSHSANPTLDTTRAADSLTVSRAARLVNGRSVSDRRGSRLLGKCAPPTPKPRSGPDAQRAAPSRM